MAPEGERPTVHTGDLGDTRELLSLAAVAEAVSAPGSHSELLESVVQIAARVIHAAAASMLLLDRSTQELVFAVAFPHLVADLAPVRVPLGQGIAGLVAMTGQPMAISQARQDPRHASTIAEKTGYLPDSLLCVPLIFADEVVGVLELMDKQGASGFDSTDMETLGLFARLAAVAIEQSRTRDTVAGVLLQSADAELQPRLQRSLELATLVHEIAQFGDDELDACAGILRSFIGYVRARSEQWRV